MIMGDYQRDRLKQGVPREAELINKKGIWFFHLILELPDVLPIALLHTSKAYDKILGVDLGENVLAALSSGKFFGGGTICHKRDCFLLCVLVSSPTAPKVLNNFYGKSLVEKNGT